MLDRAQRGQIKQMVLACRRILQEEMDRLLTLHGLTPDRVVAVPSDRQTVQARLKEAIERERENYSEARQRYIKHAAFTILNRLLALRIAEVHGLIPETIIPRPEYGDRSRRERDLADADPALAVQPEALAHQALQQAFAEMRPIIPYLFRDDDPYAILLPGLAAYRQVRDEITRLPEPLWQAMETLGWAYQYFTSEERQAIRRRLRRNPQPDDIPALNQFYTVGWIVRALVHNTLGRLWLESHPESTLRTQLDYLVPTRNDFRSPEGFSVSVEHLKVLDPACGSGHFLLGAFDLLLAMWREARPDLPPWEIPARILEHNLYGIDIDLRACQIAAMALYLKARLAFEQLRGNDPNARFAPKRLNIVCADIRFKDGDRRRQFLAGFLDPDIRQLAETILQWCEHAFEIGSLLQVRGPFEKASRRMYPQDRPALHPRPREEVIEPLLKRIQDYVRSATETHDMGSLLFGMDAERAVHLLGLLADQYDVVLMNPPYGAMPVRTKEYVEKHYPRTKSDYYTAFIEQAVHLCRPGGMVGALTGRTFLFIKSHQKLREEILRFEALPEVVWDLGFHVLDEATARYAAFTLRRRHPEDGVDWKTHPVVFFRLTDWDWDDKRLRFEAALQTLR